MKLKKQYDCNLVMMNDLIGGKWKLRILWHIMNGDNRFSMLEKTIDSITPKVLMSQLNEMEESGLILKHVLVSTPPKVVVYEINPEYSGICEIVNIPIHFPECMALRIILTYLQKSKFLSIKISLFIITVVHSIY